MKTNMIKLGLALVTALIISPLANAAILYAKVVDPQTATAQFQHTGTGTLDGELQAPGKHETKPVVTLPTGSKPTSNDLVIADVDGKKFYGFDTDTASKYNLGRAFNLPFSFPKFWNTIWIEQSVFDKAVNDSPDFKKNIAGRGWVDDRNK